MSTKKGLYLHSLPPLVTEDRLLSYGVERKIRAQCKAFSFYFDFEERILFQEDPAKLTHKIISRLPFTAISEKWKWDEIYRNIDFIYFRKNIVDNSIVRFFRRIKRNNPNCKIILEIPTYPYDKEEFKHLKDLPYKIKDRINRQLFRTCVDRITTFTSSSNQIFGIDTISIMNGIDFESVNVSQRVPDGKTINIIVMSLFSHWHGFERLIEGLTNYLGSSDYNIVLYFVGEGVAIPKYKSLVEQYHMDNNVVFCGPLHGEALNQVFDKCDIACDSLGLHHLNLEFSSTLKSREYCARGLPIVCSSKIDFIDDNFEFFLKLPSNDDPIDFNAIVKFYEAIYIGQDSKEIHQKIRAYGKDRVDMINTIQKVVKYITEDE